MSSPSSKNTKSFSRKSYPAPRGVVSSFGFTMPAEIRKKIRPTPPPFGIIDNYEPKTTPKPDERNQTFLSNNKLVTKLSTPTTSIPSKKNIKRNSMPEFQVKETYNYSYQNESKITSSKNASGQLPKPRIRYNSSMGFYKNTKEMDSQKQVNNSFLQRLTSESNSHSKRYKEEHTIKEKLIDKNTEEFGGKDSIYNEDGCGEELAVEEFKEIKDNVEISASIRNVLIDLDDSIFESLASTSTSVRIEDETFPNDELFNLTDSESEPDKPASYKLKLPTIIPDIPAPFSPTTIYFEEDYFDQPELTFNTTHPLQTISERYKGSMSSLDSDDCILKPQNLSSESVNVENIVIDDDYNHNFSVNSINYNCMYNIANQDVLSETSESVDTYDI